DEGFAAEEVEAAKRGYLESRRLSRADDGSLATTLSTHLYFDRTMEWEAAFDERVRELTVDEVNAALREYLDPGQISLVRAGSFESAGNGDGGPDTTGSGSSGGAGN
ncbi:MAG: insulinase family protein, partial [Longimicrobiales bacterium]